MRTMAMDNKASRRYNKLVVGIVLSVNKLLALQSRRGRFFATPFDFLADLLTVVVVSDFLAEAMHFL